MRRVRTVIPHCKIDAPVIDAFHCSRCEWSYAMQRPEPFSIAYLDAERACRKFDEHSCDDFKPRPTNKAAHPSLDPVSAAEPPHAD
jgi:hypothetical protein